MSSSATNQQYYIPNRRDLVGESLIFAGWKFIYSLQISSMYLQYKSVSLQNPKTSRVSTDQLNNQLRSQID